jgi:hypothetical protein
MLNQMKITLIKKLVNSPFNDNGSNTFKDIDTIYLKEVNINLIKNHYHYFRSTFIQQSMKFVANNPRQEQKQEQEGGKEEPITASAVALTLFNGDQEIINKANELIKKIAFKDECYQNPLNDKDLADLDYQDWENIICEFLANFWVSRWLVGVNMNMKKN